MGAFTRGEKVETLSRRKFLKRTSIGGVTAAVSHSTLASTQAQLTKANAMDHVIVVVFENRSFDNIFGHLYQPGEVPKFNGVIGKNLSNPVPSWAKFSAPNGNVPYGPSTDMDSPNPASGDEYYHTNTQLFNILNEVNRFKTGNQISPPYNNPPSYKTTPTMNGFVTDYISNFTAEVGREPTYAEYSQIMTGYTPEQIPVISTIGKGFGVFDHWFSEVPSHTFCNRSFWAAATSSGYVLNDPATNFLLENKAETIFNRLAAHGKTWKVYVSELHPVSFTGLINMPMLKQYFATHFVPFAEYEKDCKNGTLPNYAFIEPNLLAAHNDYHPAHGRSFIQKVMNMQEDPPSSILGGEAYLKQIYDAYKGMKSTTGSNTFNTTLFIGWDEAGGTYDHVPPPFVSAPDPNDPKGQDGFTFERSGYRVPAVIVSPWIPERTVFTDEYRHTSMIATLRKKWNLGEAFTARDAQARTFDTCFTLEKPRDPSTWPDVVARPVPKYSASTLKHLPPSYSGLAKAIVPGLVKVAHLHGSKTPSMPSNPNSEISPAQGVKIAFELSNHLFLKLVIKG